MGEARTLAGVPGLGFLGTTTTGLIMQFAADPGVEALEPDTDPLVTEPLIQRSVVADSLPSIPCLADQILIASAAMAAARRPAPAPAVPTHRNPLANRRYPPEGPPPDSLGYALLAQLKAHPEVEPRAVELWRFVEKHHRGKGWTRSMLTKALVVLENSGLITSHGEQQSHRYRAVVK